MRAAIACGASSSGSTAWKLSVWNVPQMMPFTRMPLRRELLRHRLVSVLSPALAAAYTTVNGDGCVDAFELM